jgi:hypothetical protein
MSAAASNITKINARLKTLNEKTIIVQKMSNKAIDVAKEASDSVATCVELINTLKKKE